MSEILETSKYIDPPKQEKIDGIIYNMAAGSYKHADIIGNLFVILYGYFRGKPCKPYTGELEVYFDEDNTFRPDISVICDFTKMTDSGYEGAPVLVVEVLSPGTARFDYGKKFACYQKYGVQEYWLVSPEYLTIEQYVLDNGAFRSVAVRLMNFNSYIFEDLEIDLDEVFSFGR